MPWHNSDLPLLLVPCSIHPLLTNATSALSQALPNILSQMDTNEYDTLTLTSEPLDYMLNALDVVSTGSTGGTGSTGSTASSGSTGSPEPPPVCSLDASVLETFNFNTTDITTSCSTGVEDEESCGGCACSVNMAVLQAMRYKVCDVTYLLQLSVCGHRNVDFTLK